ncbi:MAG: cytochrome c3 family protein [Candidatus Eiseniibacteriota bacterium]
MTRTRWVALVGLVLGLGGVFLAAGSLQAARPKDTLNPGIPTKPKGPAIAQPIQYSHKLHAGTLGIDCAYCHTNVDKSPVANIPNVETCMNCHKWVKRATGQSADSPEIAKLTAFYDKGQTIPWINVHELPDHAFFNHARHVKTGIACQTCHGPVQEMEVVYRVNTLEMGFCVTCHKANRENKAAPANLDCYTCHK